MITELKKFTDDHRCSWFKPVCDILETGGFKPQNLWLSVVKRVEAAWSCAWLLHAASHPIQYQVPNYEQGWGQAPAKEAKQVVLVPDP